MRLQMPITKRRVHNHFHYNLWKYLLLVAIALFGWNLIYTTTRYRAPENLKVEFYAEGNITNSDALQAYTDQIHQEIMPEMEEVTSTIVTFDDTYGDMQLVVWVSAGQGDVYLLSQTRYENMTGNGALLDLQPMVDDGTLHVEGLDLSTGYGKDPDTGKTELLGIPASQIPGLAQYGLVTEDAMLCVLYNNGNEAYTIRFLDYLITHLRTEADTSEAAIATVSPTFIATDTPAPVATDTANAESTLAPTVTASPEPSPTATATPVITPTPSPTQGLSPVTP